MEQETGFSTRQNPLLGSSPYNQGAHFSAPGCVSVKLIAAQDSKSVYNAWRAFTLAARGGLEWDEIPVWSELLNSGLSVGLESISYTFGIEGVSRACTHQLVRTRKAAIHQQTFRAVDAGEFDVNVPQRIMDNSEAMALFMKSTEMARDAYNKIADMGIPFEDARYVCPIAIRTSMVMGISLRVFAEVYSYRGCTMTMHETLAVFRQMRELILGKHPFLEPMLKISCEGIKRCTYRGAERTDLDCEFAWAADRVYKPKW